MSMKLNKTLAALSQPTPSTDGMLAQGNATAQSVIIVGFAEIEVYGLNGGTWSLIDTVEDFNQGLNPNHDGFKSDHTTVNLADYEDVFFVSKSGQEEPVRYFFVEDSVVAPTVEGSKANKLEDISDMPAFTVADAGKVLTVDALGSLIWVAR